MGIWAKNSYFHLTSLHQHRETIATKAHAYLFVKRLPSEELRFQIRRQIWSSGSSQSDLQTHQSCSYLWAFMMRITQTDKEGVQWVNKLFNEILTEGFYNSSRSQFKDTLNTKVVECLGVWHFFFRKSMITTSKFTLMTFLWKQIFLENKITKYISYKIKKSHLASISNIGIREH